MTGANGTLGRVLCGHLQQQGWQVIPWLRQAVEPCDHEQSRIMLERVRPDALFHLAIASTTTGRDNEGWLINHDWPIQLAELCRIQGIRLLFTSTAMVFSDHAPGPFTLESQPDANEGYGFEKRMAEEGSGSVIP